MVCVARQDGSDGVEALRDALGTVGLPVEDSSPSPDHGADLVLVNPGGEVLAIEVKRMALASVDGLADRIKSWNPQLASAGAIGVVVADRVTQQARDILRESGWGWLDLRGHLHIAGRGLFIDAAISALKDTARRSAPLAGRVGIEVASLLLLNPDKPVAVRGAAGALGRAPSSVSEAVSGMQAAGLLDAQRRPVVPELFWELAARWHPTQADVQTAPEPGGGSVNDALKIRLDDVRNTGWALSDSVAAVAYRAPVGIRSDHPRDFYVPDQATLRRAIHLLGQAHDHHSRAATVRVAPVSLICSDRVDATDWSDESWPLAKPLFVALDLAQDPGRGREILAGWTPPEPWHRVW